jgi:hypothetical protein
MQGDRRPHRDPPGSRRARLPSDPETREFVHPIDPRFIQELAEQYKCCIDVDDGWFHEGKFVHDPKDNWFSTDNEWFEDPQYTLPKGSHELELKKDCDGC